MSRRRPDHVRICQAWVHLTTHWLLIKEVDPCPPLIVALIIIVAALVEGGLRVIEPHSHIWFLLPTRRPLHLPVLNVVLRANLLFKLRPSVANILVLVVLIKFTLYFSCWHSTEKIIVFDKLSVSFESLFLAMGSPRSLPINHMVSTAVRPTARLIVRNERAI